MDKPMTFIEWCASKGVIPYSLGIEAAYEAGQQSMQAKVEDLQTLYTQQGINMMKMQKRVDALSKRLSEATELVVEELEQALKGEG